jgi:predicted CXXCH cytochrome family protein
MRRRQKHLLASAATLTLLVGGLALIAWLLCRSGPAPAALPDPRLTYPSAFRNVRPDVAYVPEERCAECHADIAAKYRRHPMGRSLAPVAAEPAFEDYSEAAQPTFEAAGFEYRVTRRQSVVVHEEIKRDSNGEAAYALRQEIHYAVGSGAQGRSYFFEREGYLFQSPVSWFSKRARWGLSPGYDKTEHHFERPVHAECLFCHADQVAPIADAANRYAPPTFRGYAIGCQRCHGPGELHVREQAAPHVADAEPQAAEGGTIVNPARLEPRLRDAVCEQCHLQGEQRVARMGRSLFEYRPGLPLELFVAVFVLPAELADRHKAVSHAEQLAVSKCAEKSAGKLGCIACHDPHSVPEPAARAMHYRARCLNCHEHDAPGCTLPSTQRGPTDDCVACHMPRRDSSNIAHTSVTDHRIPRRPASETAHPPARALRPEQLPLTRFHAPTALLDERDLGVALARLAVGRQAPPLATLALPRLDDALAEYPTDAAALEARASARSLVGRREEALQDLDRLLRLTPGSEHGHLLAATLARQLNRHGAAADSYRRALAINPYNSEYHHGLAFGCFRSNDWAGAEGAASAALELNPARLDTRRVLIWSLLKQGRPTEARAEFDRYRAFRPPDEETVARWFAPNAQ